MHESKKKLREAIENGEIKKIRTKGPELLSDDELENVNGGYKEGDKKLQAYGLEVYCPICLNADSGKMGERVLDNPELHTTEYHCNSCGTDFIIDKDLHASIEKNYYKQLVPSYPY